MILVKSISIEKVFLSLFAHRKALNFRIDVKKKLFVLTCMMGCKNDFQGHILKLLVLINQRCSFCTFQTITHLKHVTFMILVAAAPIVFSDKVFQISWLMGTFMILKNVHTRLRKFNRKLILKISSLYNQNALRYWYS